jgi:hypothetical protein
MKHLMHLDLCGHLQAPLTIQLNGMRSTEWSMSIVTMLNVTVLLYKSQLRQEYRLRVSKNRLLGRIFEPKTQEVKRRLEKTT